MKITKNYDQQLTGKDKFGRLNVISSWSVQPQMNEADSFKGNGLRNLCISLNELQKNYSDVL